jgi:uncharacterized repeat protein (TIGR03803 family)
VFGLLVVAVISLSAYRQAFCASESLLWSFGDIPDGASPSSYDGALIMDTNGNLYGTTLIGGAYAAGAIFKLTPDGNESVLWSFGNGIDGQYPYAGVITDASGHLYGTTYAGGTAGAGTVFELIPPSTTGGTWTESILWSFGNGTDGAGPFAGLIMDASGSLYGTTNAGGADSEGTVFKLTPPAVGGGNWSESVLWSFYGSVSLSPVGGVILGANGNLYGTTWTGGGTVFQLTPPAAGGGNWSGSILWTFGHGTDGSYPYGVDLIIDQQGNLYGTTGSGGDFGLGTAFELTPPSTTGGSWSESILWSFGSGIDGQVPFAGLIMDTNGSLYGTTNLGGAYAGGMVFKLSPPSAAGGKWSEAVLWSFASGTDDGQEPSGGLIMDPNSNLYGTTLGGGTFLGGTAFEITPSSLVGAVLHLEPSTGNFTLKANVVLGNGRHGIDLLTEALTVQIGDSSYRIPAGAFMQTATGRFAFNGTIGGVTLGVEIIATAGGRGFGFGAQGSGATLSSITTNPVRVTITVGNDSAGAYVNAS